MSVKNPLLFQVAMPGEEDKATQVTEVSLRDLFAAFALAGLLSNPGLMTGWSTGDPVLMAFGFADKMLERRESPSTTAEHPERP